MEAESPPPEKIDTRKNKTLKKGLKRLFYILLVLILLVLAASITVYIKRDDIAGKILLKVNDLHKGKIAFSRISVDPFIQFPNVSIQLHNVVYTFEKNKDNILERDTLARIKHLFATIDVLKLISGNIDVTKTRLRDGFVRINRNKDGTIDLVESLADKDNSKALPELNPDATNSGEEKNTDFANGGEEKSGIVFLNLHGVFLKNISVLYNDSADQIHSDILITRLTASMGQHTDNISGNLDLRLQINRITHQSIELQEKELALNILFLFDRKNKMLNIKLGKEDKADINLDPFTDTPQISIKYSVESFRSEEILSELMVDTTLTGDMGLDVSLFYKIDKRERPYSHLNGTIILKGSDMMLYGLDLDDLIKRYNKSQKFNLVDLGAIAVTGPVGLAVTKGSDFARLAMGSKGESTHINNLITALTVKDGRVTTDDVAFSTNKNRIAAKGWIDLPSDSLEMTFAVLDKWGCSVLSQEVFGSLKDPQQNEVKVVGTILGPITNLIDGAFGRDCDVFYDGQISQPVKKRKKDD